MAHLVEDLDIVPAATLEVEPPRLHITVHQKDMGFSSSAITTRPFQEILPKSQFLKAWDSHKTICPICKVHHQEPKLCFLDTDMTPHQQALLVLLLNDDLFFNWTTDLVQHEVFALIRYFLLDQDFVFGTFYRSLKPEIVIDPAYQFLELLFLW